MRLQRELVEWVPLVTVVASGLLSCVLLLAIREESADERPGGVPALPREAAGLRASDPGEDSGGGPRPAAAALSATVLDPSAALADRVRSLHEVGKSARRAGAIVQVVQGLRPDDPHAARLRGMAITALARFGSDPAAQGQLIASLDASNPREERLLVLATLAHTPSAAWAVPHLERLAGDQDPAIRRKAVWTLTQLRLAFERREGDHGAGPSPNPPPRRRSS